jgi:hypothetical protein
MLERAGVLRELNAELSASSEVEFWSYLNEVGEKPIHTVIPEDSTVERK